MRAVSILEVSSLAVDRVAPFLGTRPYLATGGLDDDASLTSRPVTFHERPSRADVTVQAGDVCFARMQGTEKVLEFDAGHADLILSTGFAVLRPKPDKLLSGFLRHWLHTRDFQDLKDRMCSGATQKALTNERMSQLTIPIAALEEQRRIVEVLDRAEALHATRRSALAQLATLKQSIFYEMFGDPVTNPKGSKVVRLADITTRITDGVHQKPTYTGSGVPFISVKDITTGKLTFDDCKFISPEDHQRFTKRCKPEYQDILYTKVGATYGRPAIVETDRPFSIYVSVCLIKPQKDVIDPYFLAAAMGSSAVKKQADSRVKGIGVPDLHLDQISGFLIPLPSMNEQRTFARRVSAVKDLDTTLCASLAKCDALLTSLQHRAFRGEL